MAAEVEHGQAMSASGDLNLNATLVMRRNLVLTNSMRPLDSRCSIAVRIEALYLTMRRCRSTKVRCGSDGPHLIQASRASTASS